MIFAYRLLGDDRDGCAYYAENVGEGSTSITGPCFSMQFGKHIGGGLVDYGDVETFLSREEFEQARDAGVTSGIIEKLRSPEAIGFAEEIMEDERYAMCREHGLTEEDVDAILFEYGADYRDRGLISCAFDSWEAAAEDEAWQLGYTSTPEEERYFNYDALIDDMQEYGGWMEVPSGKIVRINQ